MRLFKKPLLLLVMQLYSTNAIDCFYKKNKPFIPFFRAHDKENKSIEQHVAQLYAEKPHLQHYFLQQQHMTQPSLSAYEKLKKFLTFMKKYGIDASMLLYCAIQIYHKHSQIYSESPAMSSNHYSDIANKILHYMPKNIINAPKHTVFFLDSIEIIIKAFVLKLIIKLLIFLVEV